MIKLIPITEKALIEKGALIIEGVDEGFRDYLSHVVEGSEADMITLVERMFEINGSDHSYFDFYYTGIDSFSQNMFYKLLDEENKKKFDEISFEGKGIYYPLPKELIPFAVRLCTREILFSTFYFTKYPCTIWGNYDKKFPIFFEDEDIMKNYLT